MSRPAILILNAVALLLALASPAAANQCLDGTGQCRVGAACGAYCGGDKTCAIRNGACQCLDVGNYFPTCCQGAGVCSNGVSAQCSGIGKTPKPGFVCGGGGQCVSPTTTSTSTSTTTTTMFCVAISGTFCDRGDGTVFDSATGLQWEKKGGFDGGQPGTGTVNPSNLHDVDNRYTWAGRCTLNTSVFCQPNAAAAVTCGAQTGGAFGCGECGVGQGTCNVDPFTAGAITTIWDWVNQVNAAAFAGHGDWRLPTSAGCCGSPTGEPEELAALLDGGAPGCGGGSPCIDQIFGPTVANTYWSASTNSSNPSRAWYFTFLPPTGGVGDWVKNFNAVWVRAVRPGS